MSHKTIPKSGKLASRKKCSYVDVCYVRQKAPSQGSQAEREDMSKQKTVTRKRWHRKTDNWQATTMDGWLVSCHSEPTVAAKYGSWFASDKKWPSSKYWKAGPHSKAPVDYTTTLRRIVGRKTLEDD